MPLHIEESRQSTICLAIYTKLTTDFLNLLKMEYKNVVVMYIHSKKVNPLRTKFNLNNFNIFVVLGSSNEALEYFNKIQGSLLYTKCLYIETPDLKSILATIRHSYNEFFINEAAQFSQTGASVVVFDLDNTIIDDDDNLLDPDYLLVLKMFKARFHFMVLWSHGSSSHVAEILEKRFPEINGIFDLRISRSNAILDSNLINHRPKGIGYVFQTLNRMFGVTKLSYTCLVDDLSDNCQDDYRFFIQVPTVKPANGYFKFFREKLDLLVKLLDGNSFDMVTHKYGETY